MTRAQFILVPCLLVTFAAAAAGQSERPRPKAGGAAEQPKLREVTKIVGKVGPGEDDRFTVLVDVNDAPESKQWAMAAANYAIKWYPTICEALASEGFEPAREVTLHLKPMDGVAHASGTTLTVSSKYIKQRPDDFGMVAHELCHVIQRYRGRGGPHWLTEGIADYVRYYVVEPGSKQGRFDPQRSDYKRGYQAAAGLLNYVETQRQGTVAKLNTLLREGKYRPELFKELAGDEPDVLWEKFKTAQRRRAKPKVGKPTVAEQGKLVPIAASGSAA